MARQNFRLPLILLSVGLSIELVLTAVMSTGVRAQFVSAAPGKLQSGHSIVRVTFDPPTGGQPDAAGTGGGASRDGGTCPQDSQALDPSVTPLLPASRHGLTMAEHPTFFVYVPQTSAQKALFVLKDDKEDYYYQKTIPIPRTAGIISFKLPTDAPALEIGKNYEWSFVMICGEAIRPDSPRVIGQIQRIAPNPALSRQAGNLSPLERAALYGKDGIWYDTLTSLAEQKRTPGRITALSQLDESTLAKNWEDLLKSVGLGAIATKPLIQ